MARRRATNVFSLTFLDIMSCGFGAVILIYIVINHGTETTGIKWDPAKQAEAQRKNRLPKCPECGSPLEKGVRRCVGCRWRGAVGCALSSAASEREHQQPGNDAPGHYAPPPDRMKNTVPNARATNTTAPPTMGPGFSSWVSRYCVTAGR